MNKERFVREILYWLKTQGLPSHEQERKDGVKPGFREVTGDERVLITLDGPCSILAGTPKAVEEVREICRKYL